MNPNSQMVEALKRLSVKTERRKTACNFARLLLTSGSSRVLKRGRLKTVSTVFSVRQAVKTAEFQRTTATGLKPGVNETPGKRIAPLAARTLAAFRFNPSTLQPFNV